MLLGKKYVAEKEGEDGEDDTISKHDGFSFFTHETHDVSKALTASSIFSDGSIHSSIFHQTHTHKYIRSYLCWCTSVYKHCYKGHNSHIFFFIFGYTAPPFGFVSPRLALDLGI